MSRPLIVAAAQTGPVASPADPVMVDTAIAMIDRAAAQGVQLMVFPEVFLAPFFPNQLIQDFDRFFLAADDPVLNRIVRHAGERGVALVLPFAERAADGWFNSALVINEHGERVGCYRKTHIPAYFPNDKPGGTGTYEKFYFGQGNSLDTYPVCGTRIGVQICNDRLYPEGSRVLALKGAELIAIPVAYAVYSNAAQRSSIWEVPIRARAYENGLYVLAANRVGLEGVRQHLGRSMLVDPMGMIQAELGTEQADLLVQTIDLDEVKRARTGLAWWRDRRPSLYQSIVE